MSLTQSTSRGLLWLGAMALAFFGAVTFVAPTSILDQFPWRVGPFLAQTIGGWALGMAAMAAASASRWRPAEVIPSLTTVWLFGAGELLVVLLFADKLLISWLAMPYLLAMLVLLGSGIAGVAWLVRERPQLRSGEPATRVMRWSAVGFVLLVGALAILTATAPQGGATTEGRVFPEPMGLFSARAFAAFFTSLASGAAILIWVAPTVLAFRWFSLTGLFLIAPITLAALLNLGRFDFAGRPGHAVYLAAYLVVGAGAAWLLITTRKRPEAIESTTG